MKSYIKIVYVNNLIFALFGIVILLNIINLRFLHSTHIAISTYFILDIIILYLFPFYIINYNDRFTLFILQSKLKREQNVVFELYVYICILYVCT